MLDQKEIFDALRVFAQEGTSFIYYMALGLGLVLGLMAIKDIVNKGNSSSYVQQKGWGSIGGRLLCSSCLVTLASKLELIIATNGDSAGVKSALAYAQGVSGGGGGSLSYVWAAISMWVVFLGTAGFMRGFLLLDKASQGGHESGDKVWQGVWHVIGGALCVNIFS